MKQCPFCAEEIQNEAIICRFCQRDLPQKREIESEAIPIIYPKKTENHDEFINSINDGDSSQNIWRSKTDGEIEDAWDHLHDYTKDAGDAILAEMKRRGLLRPPTNQQKDQGLPPIIQYDRNLQCMYCRKKMSSHPNNWASTNPPVCLECSYGIYGYPSREMICPHCQTKGFVGTKQVQMKKGVSGGKLTGAVFTLGFSMLATGLSRKETLTEARCRKCGAIWHF